MKLRGSKEKYVAAKTKKFDSSSCTNLAKCKEVPRFKGLVLFGEDGERRIPYVAPSHVVPPVYRRNTALGMAPVARVGTL